jgi:FixJ family two-component response regulator
MMTPSPTVFIVDDDSAVLKSLARLLRSARLNVMAFGSPQEFLERHDPRAPGCLVLDLAMPGLNGLELQAALTVKGSAIPIIFLTGHGNIPASVQAMKRGAQAAIEKDRLARIARAELEDIQARLDSLTPREREVLTHVVSGQLNKQTAADLGTVEKTIKVHRGRVMEKMKVHSVAELVHLAERAGIRAA